MSPTQLSPESGLQSTRLSNGARIISHSVSDAQTVAVALHIQGGARMQAPEEAGFAHLIEHVLMATDAPVDDNAMTHAALFARMGAQVNGFTGREHIALAGHVPADDAEDLIAHFARRIATLKIDAATVARERQRLAREAVRGPLDDIETLLLRSLWPEHPLGNDMYPDDAMTSDTAPDALTRFWRRMLRAGAVCLFAVGAIDHRRAVEAAGLLAKLPGGESQPAGGPPRFRARAAMEFAAQDARGGRLLWAIPVENDGRCAEIVGHLLGGTQEGSLDALLAQHHLPCYGSDAMLLRYSDAGMLAFSFEVPAGDLARVETVIDSELLDRVMERLHDNPFRQLLQSLRAQRMVADASLENRLETMAMDLDQDTPVRSPDPSSREVSAWFRSAWSNRALLRWLPLVS